MNDVRAKYCFYCERPFGKLQDGTIILRTRDHIIPKKEGGRNVAKNYCYCCERCNKMKGHRMPEMFASDLRCMLETAYPKRRKTLETILSNVEKLVFEIAAYRQTLQGPIQIPNKKNNPSFKDRVKTQGLTEKRPSTPLWWRGLNEK